MSATPWGKFDAATGRTHHLAHHCADVAACFLALAELPVIRARLAASAGRHLDERDIDRLGVLVFLHDIGKLFPGFQAKAWPDGVWRGAKTGHTLQGYEIFCALYDQPVSEALHASTLGDWGISTDLLEAVLAHHGRPIGAGTRSDTASARMAWRKAGRYDPDRAAVEIGTILPRWFPMAFQSGGETLPDMPGLQHLLAGLAALADWIGSDATRFPFVDLLQPNYMSGARVRARDTLTAIGLNPVKQRVPRLA